MLVEINDESRGTYNVNSQIKFKTIVLKSSSCDYNDAYIFVKGKITITGAGNDAAARQADERDKGAAFQNCASFTNCISEINNTQIDNCKDIDIVMPLYNLLEYSNNCKEKSGFLRTLLGTLGAILLGNMLAGRVVVRAGDGTIRAEYGSKLPTH